MKFDHTDHPVSQTATRVLFACFMGFVVLSVVMFSHNHATRSTAFRAAAITLGFITLCAFITYFRPRGAAAFVTSTAYVGVFVLAGVMRAGTQFAHLNGVEAQILAVVCIAAWTALGVYCATAAHRAAREQDRGHSDGPSGKDPR